MVRDLEGSVPCRDDKIRGFEEATFASGRTRSGSGLVQVGGVFTREAMGDATEPEEVTGADGRRLSADVRGVEAEFAATSFPPREPIAERIGVPLAGVDARA